MSETVMWAIFGAGWLAVAIAVVAYDIRNGILGSQQYCNWPLSILVGWMWPIGAAAYLFVYLPAVAMNKVIK